MVQYHNSISDDNITQMGIKYKHANIKTINKLHIRK